MKKRRSRKRYFEAPAWAKPRTAQVLDDLWALKARRRWTETELARRMNVTRMTLWRWRNQKFVPTPRARQMIARFCLVNRTVDARYGILTLRSGG